MAHTLVTGGAGFIGSHLVDRLIADGHTVTVIDNLSTGKKKNVNKKAKLYVKDIREYKKIVSLFKNVDAVFHLAADPRLQVSVENPLETHETNVTGTLNVLQAARTHNVKKVVFASSCVVYGDNTSLPLSEEMTGTPLSPYGMHKLMGEYYLRLYAQLFQLPTVALRFFNVYGSRKTADGSYPMVIPIFLQQKKQGKPLTVVGDGKQTRDYVHVSDVVDACVKAWQSPVTNGAAFNVASGKQWSVNQIAGLIGGATINLPERKGEMRFVEASIAHAAKHLNWKPQKPFEQGLKELVDNNV
jgi:UDP-glucose 4-epimerase